MKKIYYYLIGIFLLIISFFLDKNVTNFFLKNRLPFLDSLALFIQNIGSYMVFALMLVFLFVFKQKNKILPLLLTFGLYLGVTGLIKIAVARPRPFTKFDFQGIEKVNPHQSFPSGHTTAASSIIKFFEFNKILLCIWILIVILIMFSRVYLGVHYLSDVVAGFILGYSISDFSIFLVGKLKRKNPKYF